MLVDVLSGRLNEIFQGEGEQGGHLPLECNFFFFPAKNRYMTVVVLAGKKESVRANVLAASPQENHSICDQNVH